MPYSVTTWVNDTNPALSATNLNKLTNELVSQAAAKSISHTLPTWVDGSAPALTDGAPLNEMERVADLVAAALALSYTPTSWGAGWTPPRNATRLNHLEAAAAANRAAIDAGGAGSALPSVINAGGTYTGTISASGTGAAVQIRTTSPVVIQDSTINHSGTGYAIDANFSGVRLTVLRTTFNGGTGQAVYSAATPGYQSIVIQNCNINKFWGIRLDNGVSGCTLQITKNKFSNQIFDGVNAQWVAHSIQCAYTHTPTLGDISWNQIINEFQQSQTEDVISLYNCDNFTIHDNYVEGAYPATIGASYSGGGIICDGPNCHHNTIRDNIVVDTMNYCLAIAGGHDNLITNNRAVCDSRNDAGTVFSGLASGSGGIGIYIADYSGTGAAFTNNRATTNTVGCINYAGSRNDTYQANGGSITGTTLIASPIDHAKEVAELTTWNNKLIANGITVGV